MNDRGVLRVQVVEPVQDIQCPAHNHTYRKIFASLEKFGKILALYELHDEKVTAVLRKMIGNVRENRMMKTI